MLRQRFLAPVLLAALVSSAFAGDIKVFGSTERVDPAEVARILGQDKPVKMRSIRLLDDAAGAPSAATIAAATVVAAEARRPAALSLPVQFSFDSAEILPGARPQLDAIAEGIRLLPPTQAVVIEGHTDSVGPELYNEQLSQRRALSVQRYLVAAHGIDPARLRAVGLGEFHTLQGRDPYAPENRRVQFRGE